MGEEGRGVRSLEACGNINQGTHGVFYHEFVYKKKLTDLATKEQGHDRSKWRQQYWKVSTQNFYLLLDYLKCLHNAYIGMFGL